jgi:hypothetical protein
MSKRKQRSATSPPPEPKAFAQRPGENLKPISWRDQLAQGKGIGIVTIPDMTPPGWEPVVGIASSDMESLNHLTELAHRLQHSGEVKEARRQAKKRERRRQRRAAEPATIVYHGEREYSMGGNQPVALTETEHMVLQAFLVPPARAALDKPTLCERSVEHAPVVLRELKKKYNGRFAAAITTPGKKGAGGYRVRIRSTR